MPIPPRRAVLHPEDFGNWDDYYWTYQHRLAGEHLLPTLREWGVWREGVRILDVGCGNGGATCALAEAGAIVEGIEIDARLVTGAVERARARGLELHLNVADVTDSRTLDDFGGPYDLVLFRDVLEHIPDRLGALRNTRDRLAEGGAVVVTFPPYLSAYGGHQQVLAAKRRLGVRWAKLPFMHWLPAGALRALAGVSGDDAMWRELLTIRDARLTLAKLDRDATACGLTVERAVHYLLRPSFRLRYGTPVLRAGGLGAIPGLREIAVMGCASLLSRSELAPASVRD